LIPAISLAAGDAGGTKLLRPFGYLALGPVSLTVPGSPAAVGRWVLAKLFWSLRATEPCGPATSDSRGIVSSPTVWSQLHTQGGELANDFARNFFEPFDLVGHRSHLLNQPACVAVLLAIAAVWLASVRT
jgi:hypothetical protein